jgi:tetratricopeptide (TPR) repeat protein
MATAALLALIESGSYTNQIGNLRDSVRRHVLCSREYVMLIRLTSVALLLAMAATGCAQDPNARKKGYLEEGIRSYRDGKYNEAVIALKNALQIDPKFVAARHLIGRTYKAKSWNADAIRELQRALELQPDDVSIRVDLGQAYLDIDAYSHALAEGKAIHERAPGNAFGAYLFGAGTLGQGQAEAALEPLSRALRLDATQPEFHKTFADALAALNRLDEAEGAYRKALDLNPNYADALVGLGKLLVLRNQPGPADELLARAKTVNPNSPMVRLAVSGLREAQGRFPDAIAELEGLPRQAWSPRVVLTLGALYLRVERFDNAAQLVGPFVRRFSEVAQGRYLLGHAYLGLGRAADAVGEFQELIKTAPANTLARYSLGGALLQAGQSKEALKELDAVAAPMKRIPEYHLQRARAYLALGRGDDAVKAANTAEQLAPQTPQPSAMLGAIYATRGDLKRAEELYARALEIDPKFIPGRIGLGNVYDLDRRPEEALKQYDAALQGDGRYGPAIAAKVGTLVRQKRVDEAIRFVTAQGDPQDAQGISSLGRLYRLNNEPRKAEEAFRRALKLNDRLVEARFALARLALDEKKEAEALGILQAIINDEPRHVPTALLLTTLYTRQARYDQGIAILENVAQANAQPPELVIALADLYLKRGRYDDAAARLSPLVAAQPNAVTPRMLLGTAYLGKGRPDAAIRQFEAVNGVSAELPANHYLLGRALLARGDVEAAKKWLTQAIRLDPDLWQVRLELAALSGQKPDDELLAGRMRDLKASLEKDQSNIGLRNALARAYAISRQPKEAEAEYTRILALAPGFPPANFAMAVIRFGEKRSDEAAEYLRAVLRTNPAHTEANVLLSRYYQAKGNLQLATQHREAVHRTNPSLDSVRLRLADLYGQVGRVDEGVALARALATERPNVPSVHMVLGVLELKRGNAAQAVEAFRTASRLEPNASRAHFALGTAYEDKGEIGKAIEAYKKARSLEGKDPAPYNNIAWIYASQGRNLEEALSQAQWASELAPDNPAILDTLGFVHLRLGHYDKAELLLRRAAEQLRNNARVHYHLGMTYYRLGRKEDAGVTLRRALQLDEKLPQAQEVRTILKELGV